MSTFKQIVEGYAGNVEQQRRSMDYEGASDRATGKIHTDEAINQLRHHIKTYERRGRPINISSDERKSASKFTDSFAKAVANPNTDERSLGRLFIIMSNIDHSYGGSRIDSLINPNTRLREIVKHPNAGEYIQGMVAMHNARH